MFACFFFLLDFIFSFHPLFSFFLLRVVISYWVAGLPFSALVVVLCIGRR